MDSERFLRVKELFQLALTWPAGERDGRLMEAAGADGELLAEVRDLLRHAAAAGAAFLDASAAAAPAPATLSIPGFRVLERLATGGSGAVYRAEQLSPRREVALKVLRLDSLGPAQAARFECENRPVLARPATAAYQARKFVRRNRALTLGTLAVVLALATGLGFALASLRVANRELAVSSEVIELFAQTMLDLTPKLGFGEEERGDLEVLLGLVERQLEAVPRSRGLRAARARLSYELASLDQARRDFAAMRARLEVAREVREELTREVPGDLESWTRLSQVYAKLGEAASGEGDAATRDRWFARALELDERLVREHPGDLELVEDLGWSLERVAMAAAERGEQDEAYRLHERRQVDAEELVRQEPANWKYLLNLTHAHHFTASVHRARGEREPAVRHAHECVRIARRLHELEPDRRDFLLWLTDVCRNGQVLLSEAGADADARAFAEEALTHAETLALGDPRRAEHLHALFLGATALAGLLTQSGEGEALAALSARLRRTLAALRRSGTSAELERLERFAAELEASAETSAR